MIFKRGFINEKQKIPDSKLMRSSVLKPCGCYLCRHKLPICQDIGGRNGTMSSTDIFFNDVDGISTDGENGCRSGL